MHPTIHLDTSHHAPYNTSQHIIPCILQYISTHHTMHPTIHLNTSYHASYNTSRHITPCTLQYITTHHTMHPTVHLNASYHASYNSSPHTTLKHTDLDASQRWRVKTIMHHINKASWQCIMILMHYDDTWPKYIISDNVSTYIIITVLFNLSTRTPVNHFNI